MAKGAKTLVFEIPMEMSEAHFTTLSKMIEGEQPPKEKVVALTTTALTELAEGGLILTGDEVKQITDATGLDPTCGSDLLPFLAVKTGFEDGMHLVHAHVDPVFWAQLEQNAEYRNWPIDQLIQETLDWCLENNHYEYLPEVPRHVLMTDNDAKEIEELIGGKFTTGTQLATLIKKLVSGDSLFEETPASEVQS